MFRCSFDAASEETVDRIFHASLVEALDSPADVVCIDEPNLTCQERAPFVELATLSRRESVAHVMAEIPADVAYERMQRNLKRLAFEKPHLRVKPFPRKVYDFVANRYESVSEGEGFSRVERGGTPVPVNARAAAVLTPRERVEREPLPLFTS